MKKLIQEYREKSNIIKQRLCEFKKLQKADEKTVFYELCFCLLTPQSKALNCDAIIQKIKKSDTKIFNDPNALKSYLKGRTRFHNKKALYLSKAFRFFQNGGKLSVKNKLNHTSNKRAREWLVKNIKGLGYKEASHFLRNIGMGKNLSIIDRPILTNLKKYKIIKEVPSSISKKTYLDIEEKMSRFCRRINIPIEELDLLFWSIQIGTVFK